MDLQVLGCYGGVVPGLRTTNFVVNRTTAVDAGALAFALPFDQQLEISDVFISHAHLDHTAALPFLIDNIFGFVSRPVVVRSIAPVIESMRRHLFNNDTWPDFSAIPDEASAILRFEVIEPHQPVVVNGVTYTAIPVNHIVPCIGYRIDDGTSSVIYSADTGPCPALYETANRTRNLRALITEVSFPNEMEEIANLSLHLTPNGLARELERLERKVDVLLYHLKPPYVEQLHREIAALGLPNVHCIDQDRTYQF
jgi:ribonuclease BN (tRNA processing enzyme)